MLMRSRQPWPVARRCLSAWSSLCDATQHESTTRPCFSAERCEVEFGIGAPPFDTKVLVAAFALHTRECLVQDVRTGLQSVALTREVMRRVPSWHSAVCAIGTRHDPDRPRFGARACRRGENARYRPDTAKGAGEEGDLYRRCATAFVIRTGYTR